jgi:hypothetical protein
MTDALDPADRKMLDVIAEHGWSVLKVSPNDGDRDDRSFAFTIGLSTSFGWPELICFGLDRKTLARLLNDAVKAIKLSGAPPEAGQLLHDVAMGIPMRLDRFSEDHFPAHLGTAIWYAAHVGLPFERLSCLRLTWPDRNGRFPGDPDCMVDVEELQRPIED